MSKIVTYLSLTLCGILITIILFAVWIFNAKLNTILEFQRISQIPTGKIFIETLGKPMHVLDGSNDFNWYSTYTPLQDKDYFRNTTIYLWAAPRFMYYIAVINKADDKVMFITLCSM